MDAERSIEELRRRADEAMERYFEAVPEARQRYEAIVQFVSASDEPDDQDDEQDQQNSADADVHAVADTPFPGPLYRLCEDGGCSYWRGADPPRIHYHFVGPPVR